MTKQELISYLDVVCNAESAVQACWDAKCRLEYELNTLQIPPKPQDLQVPSMPAVYRDVFGPRDIDEAYSSEVKFIDSVVNCLVGIVVGIACFMALSAIQVLPKGFPTEIAILVGIATWYVSKLIRKQRAEEAAKKAVAEAEAKYTARLREVEEEHRGHVCELEEENVRRMALYQKACDIVSTARVMLEQQLREQQLRYTEVVEKRDKVYQRGTIYSGFCNLVAVFAIREYLKMGICSDLEGPNGAYAQYMQDVRAQRICDSVDELRATVESSVSQLQTTLVYEMNAIRNSIQDLGAGISGTLNALGQSFRLTQQNATAQIRANMAQMNETLSRLQNGTTVIAYNQYMANRMSGVDAYLN